MANKKYTFIDLFAGCGGLSEGFYRLGFKALAHVEINHWACETLRTRMRHYGYKNFDKEVIEHDITIIAKTKCAFFQNEMCIFCVFFAVSQLVLNGLLNGF